MHAITSSSRAKREKYSSVGLKHSSTPAANAASRPSTRRRLKAIATRIVPASAAGTRLAASTVPITRWLSALRSMFSGPCSTGM